MKYLIEVIEQGAKKEGDQKHLEAALGLAKGTITEVKAGRRGLPIEACYKLVDITDADLARVIAESEAITAKAEKAEFWKKKLMEFEKLAACVLVGVIFNMSPTPAEANDSGKSLIKHCILCQIIFQAVSLKYTLSNPRLGCAPLKS